MKYIEKEGGDDTVKKEKNNNRSTRTDYTRSAIEDKRNTPESQLRIAVPAKISDSAINSA
jgi:hypothetical protein